MAKIVKWEHELGELTEDQRAQLRALNAMDENEIDLSDIPELTEAELMRMRPGRYWREETSPLSIRVENDILEWLRRTNRNNSISLNDLLREAMHREEQTPAPKVAE